MPTEIVCTAGGKKLVLLAVNETPSGRIALLNTHTYNQADFDAVGEVLLCPRPLGLLDMDGSALAAFRAIFSNCVITENNKTIMSKPMFPLLDGPGGITIHPFDDRNCVVQNFNDSEVSVVLTIQNWENKSNWFIDRFTKKTIPVRIIGSNNTVSLDILIPARGRVWIHSVDF